MQKQMTSTARRPRTDEQRERLNAYLRRYRAEHPDKVKAWRDAYILRRAARLLAAEQAAGEADAD